MLLRPELARIKPKRQHLPTYTEASFFYIFRYFNAYRIRRYIAVWAFVVCMNYRSYRESGAFIVLTIVPDL
jgi:hypothetical protein